MHVSAAVESGDEIVFLHEIEAGPASRSYGVQVARLAGMPPTLLRQARAALEALEAERDRAASRRSTCSPRRAADARRDRGDGSALRIRARGGATSTPICSRPGGARRALPPEGLAERHCPMTYCVGIKLDAGLVFLSDSRTNAGLDQISTFRKMMVYERPGDRFMVMLSAGNLSISQSVREILQVEKLDNGDDPPITIWNATSMFDAARVLGAAVRRVYDQDGASLKSAGPRLQRLDDLRRPDQRRGDAPVPGLLGRQLHRGDARDLLLPDRRIASTASPCSTA